MPNAVSTICRPFVKAFSTNAVTDSFAALIPTITEPTGEGVIDAVGRDFNAAAGEGFAGNQVDIRFFGTDANDEAFNAKVTGWREIDGLWIPVPLITVLCTLSSSITGVAAKQVINTDMFADTIALVTAFTSAYELISPTGDAGIAALKLDVMGCEKVQIQIDLTSAASGNALLAEF